jgi:hypothetical protein
MYKFAINVDKFPTQHEGRREADHIVDTRSNGFFLVP